MVKNSAESVLVWLVTFLPLVLLWAAVMAVVVWLVCRLVRRRRQAGKRQTPPCVGGQPQPPAEPAEPGGENG